jgi:hypothetical protein
MAVYYRTNLTMRQQAPLFGVSPVPGTTAGAGAWRDSGLVVPHRKRPGRQLLKGDGRMKHVALAA